MATRSAPKKKADAKAKTLQPKDVNVPPSADWTTVKTRKEPRKENREEEAEKVRKEEPRKPAPQLAPRRLEENRRRTAPVRPVVQEVQQQSKELAGVIKEFAVPVTVRNPVFSYADVLKQTLPAQSEPIIDIAPTQKAPPPTAAVQPAPIQLAVQEAHAKPQASKPAPEVAEQTQPSQATQSKKKKNPPPKPSLPSPPPGYISLPATPVPEGKSYADAVKKKSSKTPPPQAPEKKTEPAPVQQENQGWGEPSTHQNKWEETEPTWAEPEPSSVEVEISEPRAPEQDDNLGPQDEETPEEDGWNSKGHENGEDQRYDQERFYAEITESDFTEPKFQEQQSQFTPAAADQTLHEHVTKSSAPRQPTPYRPPAQGRGTMSDPVVLPPHLSTRGDAGYSFMAPSETEEPINEETLANEEFAAVETSAQEVQAEEWHAETQQPTIEEIIEPTPAPVDHARHLEEERQIYQRELEQQALERQRQELELHQAMKQELEQQQLKLEQQQKELMQRIQQQRDLELQHQQQIQHVKDQFQQHLNQQQQEHQRQQSQLQQQLTTMNSQMQQNQQDQQGLLQKVNQLQQQIQQQQQQQEVHVATSSPKMSHTQTPMAPPLMQNPTSAPNRPGQVTPPSADDSYLNSSNPDAYFGSFDPSEEGYGFDGAFSPDFAMMHQFRAKPGPMSMPDAKRGNPAYRPKTHQPHLPGQMGYPAMPYLMYGMYGNQYNMDWTGFDPTKFGMAPYGPYGTPPYYPMHYRPPWPYPPASGPSPPTGAKGVGQPVPSASKFVSGRTPGRGYPDRPGYPSRTEQQPFFQPQQQQQYFGGAGSAAPQYYGGNPPPQSQQPGPQ